MRISKSLRKLLACMMAVIIAAAYMPMAFAEDDSQEPEIIKIATAEDLMNMATAVNEGREGAATAYYKLTADINLADVLNPEEGEAQSWTAIGNSSNRFEGMFDGDDHKIVGLEGNQGLFGYVDGATIKNVTVYGAIETESKYAAGIVAHAEGKTEIDCVGNFVDVTSTYTTTSTSYDTGIAGIVGYVPSDGDVVVKNSFNKASIKGCQCTGGIAGRPASVDCLSIESCYNAGAVKATVEGSFLLGGLAGSRCTLANCYNTGSVDDTSAKAWAITGGTANNNNGTPTVNAACYWLDTSTPNKTVGSGGNYPLPIYQRTAEEFADTTEDGVLNELNAEGYSYKWIAGSKVVVSEEEDPQAYPGLFWEASLADQKENAKDFFAYLADKEFPVTSEDEESGEVIDNYYQAGIDARAAEIKAGKDAIDAAGNRADIKAAIDAALVKIDDVLTKAEIDEAIADLEDIADDNEYEPYQAKEIQAIVDGAAEEFKGTTSINDLVAAFEKAVKQFEDIPNKEEVAAANAAKEDLEQTMISANSIMASGEYSAESLAVLKDALAKADKIYNDPDAFEDEVEDARKAVNAALRGLKPGTDGPKSDLLSALIGAQEVDHKQYTADSYAALKAAVDKAKTLIEDPNATPEALRDAKVAVLEAQKNLVKKSANKMIVKTKKKTVRLRKVWRKKRVVKPITVKNAQGKVTYKKVSGSKKLTVNEKTGKVTVKKRTFRGTYTIKVKVTAAGNDKVLAKSKTVKVKVRVR